MMQKMDAVGAEIHEEGDRLILDIGMPYSMPEFTHGNTFSGTITQATMSSSPIGDQLEITLRINMHG